MSGSGLASLPSMLIPLHNPSGLGSQSTVDSGWGGWVSLAKGLLALRVIAEQPAPLGPS